MFLLVHFLKDHTNATYSQDDTFEKSADLGGILGSIVVDSLKSFTTANNQLMGGQSYGDADIRSYLSGGAFLAYPGVDKNAVTDAMTNMLVGVSINQLYRTQKIFIMGGGACDDNQGIGSGPQEATVCRNGQAWYLYYWQENDVISTTSHQWGWVASPPGADQLGQGAYSGVSVQVCLPTPKTRSLTNGPRTSSTRLSMRTMSPATTMMPIQLQAGPQMLFLTPGQALAPTVRLGKVSSLSRFVMSVVQSTPTTRIRSTSCSRMDMIAVLSGVVRFAVVIPRRRVTLSMLLIWVDSKALSISATRTLDTKGHVSARVLQG